MRARGGTLVLGGGFAGAYVARYLGRRGVTIVSPENSVLFTPMLPEAASRTRMMCPHAELILGRAVRLDEAGRDVQIETEIGPRAVGYDALDYSPALRKAPQHWVLVDAVPKIFPEIPTRLGEYAARLLARRGVDIRVSTRLESVERDGATLSDADRRETRTLVWTAGVRADPLLTELGLPVDEKGRVRAESTPRVERRQNVWALGDCASVPNAATPEHPDPPTSQHALRQARRLAKNPSGEPRPYRYRMLGQAATLGRHKGIADVLGVRLRGFAGWWVTRTSDLYQLPLLSRKLRVVTDWTVSLLFRRDIAELSMLGHPRRLE